MKITGLGKALPALTVTNDDLAEFLDTSDEWISSRTGISSRQLITSETIEDLATAAAKEALDAAGITAQDIDYILCCNSFSTWMTPGLGCIVGDKLALGVPSLDINGACAGFMYALELVQSLLVSNSYKRILIVCAETPTHMIDWTDRSTCVLFGDAAAAVVVEKGGEDASFLLKNEPGLDFLYARNPRGNSPYCTDETQACFVQMNGQEVYRFAVNVATRGIKQLVDEAQLSLEDVDYFCLHQANMRIIEAARSRFKQPREKFPTNIEHRGNTLSASIPLLLHQLAQEDKLKPGTTLAMSAFGAGLTSGACLMRW